MRNGIENIMNRFERCKIKEKIAITFAEKNETKQTSMIYLKPIFSFFYLTLLLCRRAAQTSTLFTSMRSYSIHSRLFWRPEALTAHDVVQQHLILIFETTKNPRN